MLSGVGPADHLAEHGIAVVADLPGVGANLHDHLLSPVIFSAERAVGPPAPGLPACQTHLFARSRPGLAVPDLQPIHFMVPMYEPWMEGPENGFTLMGGMVRPVSRGTIRLSGPAPDDPLLIDPNALACEADLESLVAAVKLVRRMGASEALRAWGAQERYPGPEATTEEDLRRYVRDTAITYHHQAGTCKMGTDEAAVVDPRLRVHGVEGLRVADASIMPAVTTGNTNAPSLMIGERVAGFVAGDDGGGAAAYSRRREPQVERALGRELARVRAPMQLRVRGALAPGRDDPIGIDGDADRVGRELGRGAHELRRALPVAEVVGLQLDAVAVGIDEVERQRHPVVEHHVRARCPSASSASHAPSSAS